MDTSTVQALAPDQASLKAAAKLTGRAKWPLLREDGARGLAWGECQGSGANPYRTVVDLKDHGTKCSCPSRKFPCKHALALMWIRAERGGPFEAGSVPDWVEAWSGRRRVGAAPKVATSGAGKDLAAARLPEAAKDPRAAARAEAAAAKRAAHTARALDGAMDDLDAWLADQLRLGLVGFVDGAGARCRAIAARMVDGKAAALAGRLDELPARLLELPPEARPRAAMAELGVLALIARAHRAAPDDPDVRRAVKGGETRETALAEGTRVAALWEVAGTRIVTRRDGLVSQSTWLMAVAGPDGATWKGPPRFALLLDHTPAGAGTRAPAFASGTVLAAELAFHPSRAPLRAVIAERGETEAAPPWPDAPEEGDPLAPVARHLARDPFAQAVPLTLGPGRVSEDGRWIGGGTALPLAGTVPEAVLGMALERSVGVWDGQRLDLLAARTAWGRVAP